MKLVFTSGVLAAALFLGRPAHAQVQTGSILIKASDQQSAVMPGVSVTISSPVLVAGSMTGMTDVGGVYRFPSLVPGTYRVTYTLPGFGTVVREGIVLTAAFTASVDVSMAVGAVAETVTVSGQSPLVDIQATTQRRALTSELLNELPTGRSFQNVAILVPGVQTARAENATVQYFARLFGETTGEGRRVVYAESLWDEEKALSLLGTLRLDGKLAEAVFGDRFRMYRDFLADGARAAIDDILAPE